MYLWELQIVPIDFIHDDCTLVLYKQLIQTGFGCNPIRLYSVLGFPLYEDTDLRKATAHQLYCFAIEVGFGANGSRWIYVKTMPDPPVL